MSIFRGLLLSGGIFIFTAQPIHATVDLSFNAGDFHKLGGALYDVAIDGDDLVFVGFFDRINENLQSSIIKVSSDGTLDTSFLPNVTGSLTQIEIQDDGKILVAGSLTKVDGQSQSGLARLNTDGSFDSTYTASLSHVTSKDAMVLDANGRVVLGGSFASVNGQNQSHLARFNTNGTLDPSFAPTINDDVKAIFIQSDGKLIIGGYFTTVNGVTRNKIARLNADGSLDSAFNPNAGTEILRGINSIDVRADGKIAIAGGFTSLAGEPSSPVAVLNSDGSVFNSFDASISSFTNGKVAFLADGKLLVGGNIGLPFSSPITSNLVRLGTDGSLDETYDTEIDWLITNFILDSSENVILTGLFSELTSNAFTATSFVDTNGTVGDFNLGVLEIDAIGIGVISDAELQADGKVVIGGEFSSINNITRQNIARLNSDGSVDSLFNASTDKEVKSLSIQEDGKILIAGNLDIVNEIAISNLARLNTDGSLDADFTPNPNCIVHDVLSLSDANILIAGCFSVVDAQAQSDIALLDSNGTLVTGFRADIEIDSLVYALQEQADGNFLVGGDFSQVNNVARDNLARLGPNGALDNTFNPLVDGSVRSIINTADNKIAIAGFFNNVGGQQHQSLAKLNLDGSVVSDFSPSVNSVLFDVIEQEDSKFLVGGIISSVNGTSASDIARINADGTLDPTFNPIPNSTVEKILLQADGKILITGRFRTVSGQERSTIARVEKTLPPEVSISPSNIQQTEGDEGDRSYIYTLTRINDLAPTVTLDFSVSGIGDNPSDANDFGGTFPSGSVTLNSAESSTQLIVDVSSDYFVESNEQFTVTLSNPSVGTIGESSANALIVNDDTDDEDGDGIAAGGDNCPLISNPDQTNTDGSDDGGDACDEDDDNDTVNDDIDNCRLVDNTNQQDTDSDLAGDVCDSDDDNDGVPDGVDDSQLNPFVCRDLDVDSCDDCSVGVDQFGPLDDFNVANDGEDTNADGQCNLSDPDDDGDMVPDENDNCPLIANSGQEDENGYKDGEGAGDACEDRPEEICIPIPAKTGSVTLICL